MSDPVTNAEVEDVLSSIRRLVSEDKRPMQAFKESVSKEAEPSDRLVLTPALRVAEAPQDADSPERAEAPQDVDDFARNVQQMTAAAENAPNEVETEQSGGTDEADLHKLFEDEAPDQDVADPEQDYSDDPYSFADDADGDGEGDEKAWLRGQPADESLDDVDASTDTASLTAKIEALETAIGNISDTWEPDAPGEDEYSGTDAPGMTWEDEANDQARLATGDDQASEAEMDVAVAIDADAEQDEDDDAAPGIFASTRHHTEDAPDVLLDTVIEPDVVRENSDDHQPSSAAQNDDEGDFDYGSDDQVIDEEALRDLVSEIVRSELQGALGERITRNVRKLVRREIHRALTAQEME